MNQRKIINSDVGPANRRFSQNYFAGKYPEPAQMKDNSRSRPLAGGARAALPAHRDLKKIAGIC
jgi:hypothetical protein